MSDIEIRPYRAGDENDLVALFSRCFGREITLAHWQWKLRNCSAGYENIWVATLGQKLVGQYVGAPLRVSINDNREAAIAIFDTMVDPVARRMGVLTRVGQAAHNHWRDAGVKYGFGLPNQQWGSRAAALGWVPLFPLRWLVRILRPESILAQRFAVDAFNGLTFIGNVARRLAGRAKPHPEVGVRRISAPTMALDRVASRARRGEIQVLRGADWVDRRYLRCPSTDFIVLLASRGEDPVAYGVYKLQGSPPVQATVVEVIAASGDEAAYATVLAEIERRCIASRASTIRALAVPGTEDYMRLRKYGFLPRRAAFTLQYVPFDPSCETVRDVSSWHFQGGDFDVV